MKFKYILIAVLLVISFINFAGDKKKGYIRFDKTSKMKKYNPNAVWRKVECKYCNGTGHKTKTKYDTKKNRTIKWLVPYPYCKGKGTRGMSKY